jgi:photosystem II stability/assembly factor-like uncharacterized protein
MTQPIALPRRARLGPWWIVLALLVLPARAQPTTGSVVVPTIERNRIAVMEAGGGRLWLGAALVSTADGGATFRAADIDSLRFGSERVSSLSVDGDTVWAGRALTVETTRGATSAAAGLTVTRDGGRTWTLLPPPLDLPSDTLLAFGADSLPAVPFVAAVEATPLGLDRAPSGTLWLASFRAGLRRSDNGGRTWRRVVLPPDGLTRIAPSDPFVFLVAAPRTAQDTLGSFNYWTYDVLVDQQERVWVGTERGLNVSRDGGQSWQRYDVLDGLSGNQVSTLAEQVTPGGSALWAATAPSGAAGGAGQSGLSVTRDGGQTWAVPLVGENVRAIAFDGARVLAAAASGLLVSDDDGQTWRTQQSFFDPSRPDEITSPDISVLSVAVQGGFVWVGTDEGLFRSDDPSLQSWRRFRVDVGLSPDPDDPRARAVETYAYPNPFSPASAGGLRIRVPERATRVRIFDFEMRLVRTLDPSAQAGDGREALWDGRDAQGYRVPNGPYFYAVDGGGAEARGKILVVQ